MPRARKLARLRFVYGVGSILASAIVVGPAKPVADPGDAALVAPAIPFAAIGAASFWWLISRWQPRCRQCGAGKRQGAEERLRCDSCRYDEPTGWSYE